MQNKTYFTTQEIVFIALMTALVFIATYLPHIPIPLGYAHLGDAVIFLLALLAPRRAALFAACIGSALADLLGGFALWIVPTLVIKLVMAEIVYRAARSGSKIGGVRASSRRSSYRAYGWRRRIRLRVQSSTRACQPHSPRPRDFSWRGLSTPFLRCCFCPCCGSGFRSFDMELSL